jgi:hypothetical protein
MFSGNEKGGSIFHPFIINAQPLQAAFNYEGTSEAMGYKSLNQAGQPNHIRMALAVASDQGWGSKKVSLC